MRGVGEDDRGEGSVAAGEMNKAKVMSTGVRNYLVCAGKGAGMEEACRLHGPDLEFRPTKGAGGEGSFPLGASADFHSSPALSPGDPLMVPPGLDLGALS